MVTKVQLEQAVAKKVDMGSEAFVKEFTKKVAGFSEKISQTSKN